MNQNFLSAEDQFIL